MRFLCVFTTYENNWWCGLQGPQATIFRWTIFGSTPKFNNSFHTYRTLWGKVASNQETSLQSLKLWKIPREKVLKFNLNVLGVCRLPLEELHLKRISLPDMQIFMVWVNQWGLDYSEDQWHYCWLCTSKIHHPEGYKSLWRFSNYLQNSGKSC